MKKFRFRLERLLAWRQTLLELEEQRMRSLAIEREALYSRRVQLVAEKTRAELLYLAQAKLEAPFLEQYASGQEGLDRLARRLHSQTQALDQRIAEQHCRLLEARRQVRLLERLRAKQWTEWESALNREIEALAAEMHLARWARQNQGQTALSKASNPEKPKR